MFSLIITIISIALVAALALATIYYGGSAFTRGGDAAKASQLINEGQQLQGARTLAVADAAPHATTADLITGEYLSQIPNGWEVGDGDEFVNSNADLVTAAVCAEVNRKSGQTGSVALDDGVMYGCTTEGGVTMRYRF